MEYRREFKRGVEDELREVKSVIRQNENTIARLSYDKQPFRTVELIEKARRKVEEYQQKEKNILQKLEDIDAGLFDSQLMAQRKHNTEMAKIKTQKTLAKKQKRASPPKTNKEREQQRKKDFAEKKSFVTERDMAMEYEYFMRSCGKFPANLAERLENMPQNEGIIFNRIWFFGKRPERHPVDVVTMQDKQGDKFYVHYYTDTDHSVFLKKGYGKHATEVFVKREYRKRIPCYL